MAVRSPGNAPTEHERISGRGLTGWATMPIQADFFFFSFIFLFFPLLSLFFNRDSCEKKMVYWLYIRFFLVILTCYYCLYPWKNKTYDINTWTPAKLNLIVTKLPHIHIKTTYVSKEHRVCSQQVVFCREYLNV